MTRMNSMGEFLYDEEPRRMKLKYSGSIRIGEIPEPRREQKRKKIHGPKPGKTYGKSGEMMKCEQCGREFTRKRRDQRFCSRKCGQRFHSRQKAGETR